MFGMFCKENMLKIPYLHYMLKTQTASSRAVYFFAYKIGIIIKIFVKFVWIFKWSIFLDLGITRIAAG